MSVETVDPQAGPALPDSPDCPFRGELYGPDRLEELAFALANRWHATARPCSRTLLRRLKRNEKLLWQARDVSAESAAKNERLTPDAEWLLDNFFVIEDVLREVRTDLPGGYYDELPAVPNGEWEGYPRVYALAVNLLTHTDSHLDEDLIQRFTKAFQRTSPLTIGELWAVPTTLRLALLENLCRLAAQMLAVRAERDRALEWVRQAVDLSAARPLPDHPSDSFLVSWHQAVRDLSDTQLSLPRDWTARLEAGDLTDVLHREHRRQAANQVSVGNCVTGLRLLQAVDWTAFFERVSLVEAALLREPTDAYARQEFATRDSYRKAVETMAKAANRGEVDAAAAAVARAAAAKDPRARHVGYHLIGPGRDAFAESLGCRFKLGDRWQHVLTGHPHAVYFGGIAAVTSGLVALAAGATLAAGGSSLLAALAVIVALLPANDVAVGLVNFLVCRLLPPRVLPKYDFAAGIPEEFRTVVVIPGMLTKPESVAALCERLELHYLANPDPQLRFALLTDLADAPAATAATDDDLVQRAVAAIRSLNARHAGTGPDLFFLFHRERKYNPSEGAWMGWERKRGKLDEFNRLLRGEKGTSYTVRTGDAAALRAKFVLTLDADTVLPRDAARRLIGTLAHPLNRPVLSPDGRSVTAGYGLLQPRVSFLYGSGLRSRFARTFAGSAGVDPYSAAASDVYQDLFGQGTFTGKGLYDVDAFAATAGRAFPDNAVLSHDLIESNFARCGLVTDVEVFDDFPAKYHAYANRDHRWVRGDWQLLPWLGRSAPSGNAELGSRIENNVPNSSAIRVPRSEFLENPVTVLGKWKIIDNLRRSLVPVAVVVFLAVGWTVLPGAAWIWSLLAFAVIALPLGLQLFDTAAGLLRGGSLVAAVRAARQNLGSTAGQVLLTAAFLANQAVFAADAIARTLYRLFVSRKRLLEWETAAAAEARLGTGLGQFVRVMRTSVLVAAALAAIVAVAHPPALIGAAPWLVAWLVAPGIAYLVSRPLPAADVPLTDAERDQLRRTARKTWRFFETFVTAEDNWLPPDNYQEEPHGVVAHRTSPTNKGLLLLSALSAHDLGYIALDDLAERFEKTLATFDKLERYRGHFLNWYDTKTLHPLPPAYVSSVDSGNLLACLLAVKNGLRDKANEPVPPAAVAEGLLDALKLAAIEGSEPAALLADHFAAPPDTLLAWDDWLERAAKLANELDAPDGEPGVWVRAAVAQVKSFRAELTAVCPWLPELRALVGIFGLNRASECGDAIAELNAPAGLRHWADRLPKLRDALRDRIPSLPEAAREPAGALAAATDRTAAGALRDRLEALADRCRDFADAMDFHFLYNESRHLFSIGYNVPLERLDAGHYDLLASEALTTSFLMVARGVVPRKHWFRLGRLFVDAAGRPGLMSWGGTMFEYLMPRLFLLPPPGTLLDVAQKATVARHQEYGRQTRLPWGVSESGFAVLSPEGDYQYQSFGVPGLGLKRGLAKDHVVAPYATLLAVTVDAAGAVANFPALAAAGGEGPYGFYEALDYTPERLARGQKCRVVRSYMAHHQGMGLAAIANRVLGDVHCRRLHAEPAVRSVELLLAERLPAEVPEVRVAEADVETAVGPVPGADVNRLIHRADTPAPRAHLLSNGHYTVMVTNAGGGFSTCRGKAVTRWRADATRDAHGSFLYVRDRTAGRAWSSAFQPTRVPPDEYEVLFSADKAEFRRRDGFLHTLTEVTVSPDEDAEVRRVTLANHDDRPHTLEVTSYAEIVLNEQAADTAHPAFGKLFLETERLPQGDALICRRRSRAPNVPMVWAVHAVAAEQPGGRTECETDRAKFLGRRRTAADPQGLTRPLTGTTGPVLDTVFCLRRTVTVDPGTSAQLVFVTALVASREAAVSLADHYRSTAAATRAFDLAWAHSRVELRHLGITAAESHLFQRLAGHVLFPPPALRSGQSLRDNREPQSGLWRFGIGGDLPILALSISDNDGLSLARHALKAHAFWRGRGFPVDLVLLADRPASYREELYESLSALARSSDSRDVIDKPGGVFVRKVQPGSGDWALLLAAARVVLYGERGGLSYQVDALGRGRKMPAALLPKRAYEADLARPGAVENLLFANGTGGFKADGREYVVTGVPPLPWTNVVANPNAGFLATDSGLGYTWAGNSQANRLTPWSNDPVSDPPGEVVYLRDEETGAFWSPTPLPVKGTPTVVRHGAGYTTYTQDRDGISSELTAFVPVADPVKIVRLRVTNRGKRPRSLSAAFYAEWVLGPNREQSAAMIVTNVDHASGAVFARNAFNTDFGDRVAFADTSLRPRTVCGDRYEFVGRNRSVADPAAMDRVGLSDFTGPGLDPCCGLHGRFDLPPGKTAEIVFVLGQAADDTAAGELAKRYREPAAAEAALREVTAAWDHRLSTIRVETPDPAFDLLVNRWLPYQVLSCRLWGRSAFYQSGGAYGFRDQLQDVLALVYAEPGEARAQILRAAARQFPEGDVQHWWHPPTGRGVRTRFSDDFLWLPFAVARYVEVTGDTGVLHESVPLLHGRTLNPEEHEAYFQPEVSNESESVYAHCLRALAYGWRLGEHGLPLMGCGDWNDGMNLVGAEGKGESVWVGWFQVLVRRQFAAVAEARGDADTAVSLRGQSKQLLAALDEHAWDGEWYLRAWFDNGTPLGSASNDECRIDSLPQSWAVIAGGGDPDRAAKGVDSALRRLVDLDARLVKLFEPAFDAGILQPGYIRGYVPGTRENGGQYTHAAAWLVQAVAAIGRGGEAVALWRLLNPVTHTDTADGAAAYKGEPFVVAGDVYSLPPHTGRVGWSWYTGSAAWLYRGAVESILGLVKAGDRFTLDPCVPAAWQDFLVEYRFGNSSYRCAVENPDGVERGVREVWLDGSRLPTGDIALRDDGKPHEVRFVMGK